MTRLFVGIDVSKSTLDIHIAPLGEAFTVANSAAGHRRLIRRLAREKVGCCLFEATGPYSRLLHVALDQAGFPVSRVNPRQSSFYIKSHTPTHKTDKSDAEALAHMAGHMDLPLVKAPSAVQEALRECVEGRKNLMKQKIATSNRMACLTCPLLKKQARQLIAFLERAMADIDAHIQKLVSADAEMKRKASILQTIPGLGAASACAILSLMPEIGSLKAKQVAALLGVAPQARDSGAFKGRRHCRGGRTSLRTLLYMPTLSAVQSCPSLQHFYDRLRSRGKNHKVAIIAAMRKLIILANSLVKNDARWAENP